MCHFSRVFSVCVSREDFVSLISCPLVLTVDLRAGNRLDGSGARESG